MPPLSARRVKAIMVPRNRPLMAASTTISGRFGLIGRSGAIGASIMRTLLTRPTDLLVCELAHFMPGDLFTTLRGHAVKRAAFIHVARHLRQRLAPVHRLAAVRLPEVAICFPKDGDVLKV